MGRQISNGLELSFHQASKRWCKVVGGQRIYFGHGRGKSDRTSYFDALKAYRTYQRAVQAEQAETAEVMGNERLGLVMTEALAHINRQLDADAQAMLRQFLVDVTTKFDSVEIVDEQAGTTSFLHRSLTPCDATVKKM